MCRIKFHFQRKMVGSITHRLSSLTQESLVGHLIFPADSCWQTLVFSFTVISCSGLGLAHLQLQVPWNNLGFLSSPVFFSFASSVTSSVPLHFWLNCPEDRRYSSDSVICIIFVVCKEYRSHLCRSILRFVYTVYKHSDKLPFKAFQHDWLVRWLALYIASLRARCTEAH